MECEYNLFQNAYLGSKEVYQKKLSYLARIAQPEIWRFKEDQPYEILENYLCFTYDKLLQEQNKIISTDKNMFFNTGLLTKNNQDIYAYFEKNTNIHKKDGQDWYLKGFYNKADPKLKDFDTFPTYADYYTNPEDFIFDRNKELTIDYDHIIDDNEERFISIGVPDKHMMKMMLTYAVDLIKDKVKRNYKLAIPQLYTDKTSKQSKIQLLLPLYLKDEVTPNLALAVDRQASQYVGKTILSLEWAYMNSRRIAKPAVDWLTI